MADGNGSRSCGCTGVLLRFEVGAARETGRHFNRNAVAPHACVACGIETTKPMYCSDKCRTRWHRRTRPAKFAAYRNAQAERYKRAYAHVRLLKQEVWALRWIARRVRLHLDKTAPVACIDCGAHVPRRKHMRPVCAPCRDKKRSMARQSARANRKGSPAYRKAKLAYKVRRRNREVAIEAFDPIRVLERDGWRCYLCGVETPKALRGQMVPNAPEVDHVVPLAAGGEHSMKNTRCACRQCNGKKGASLVPIAA